MDIVARIKQQFTDSAQTKLNSADALAGPIASASRLMFDALEAGNKILACGNGGSAADCQHFAAELIGRFERERKSLGAIALTTDSSILTAIGNDYSYHDVFSKQVYGLGKPGDILLAISTSGNSKNVLQAIAAAHESGLRIVALTGKDGGLIGKALRDGDVHLCVPHQRTARIQEVHLLILHCLCDAIDEFLLGSAE